MRLLIKCRSLLFDFKVSVGRISIKFSTTSGFILKRLDYSLSISMRDRWMGLRPRQPTRDRNLDWAHNPNVRCLQWIWWGTFFSYFTVIPHKNLAILDLEFPGFTNFFNKLFQLITFVVFKSKDQMGFDVTTISIVWLVD